VLNEDSPEPPAAGALDAALAAVEDWVDTPQRLRAGADELGAMGLPPKDRPIAIDGASVAWAHGRRARFSVEGLRRCLDFFAGHGYRTAVAFVPLAFTQPPPEGSRRTRVADDVTALLALRAAGRVELTPSGADDGAFAVQFARARRGFVVTNSPLDGLRADPAMDRWLHGHRITFDWLGDDFVPSCDWTSADDEPGPETDPASDAEPAAAAAPVHPAGDDGDYGGGSEGRTRGEAAGEYAWSAGAGGAGPDDAMVRPPAPPPTRRRG
jgi:hypothetical protein